MRSVPIPISPEKWLHILFGDDKGGGHLAHQGIEGKTEYPEHWTLARIEQAIFSAQENIISRNGGLWPGVYDELVDGLLLRIVLKSEKEQSLDISSAFPLRGHGVFRNIEGERISRPLLRQDRKK